MGDSSLRKRSSETDTNEELEKLRHSAAHVLAQAVKRLWPKTQLAIGPPIRDGFYYDVLPPEPITEKDLAAIEEEMHRIIEAGYPFEQSWMTKEEADRFFAERGEPFKREIIQSIPEDRVSIYRDGEFVDLCEGPHVESSDRIKAVKLLSIAGAYWRGDERGPQLTRIYGTAFFDSQELEAFLKRRKEAQLRDHRKLGPSLGLFSIFEEAGAGLVFYHPKGAVLREIIEDYAKAQHRARGYQPVLTPHILRSTIWIRSGHYEQYRPNMYLFKTEDGQEWGLKPMNCPGHILIYQSTLRSYRELPIRFFELGTVYRNEKSGVLHGLLRVRGFTQDDAHLFCRPDQLEGEICGILDFIQQVFQDFGFSEYRIEMSTRPKEFLGNPDEWEKAEAILKGILHARRIHYDISPGAGAFYGPKIDVHVKDSLGRDWQCATVQLDFVLPKRFGLEYMESDGRPGMPVMIHRAIFGSLERFIGTLIEHYAGAFPVWLAPIQVMVIPIAYDQIPYAQTVQSTLRSAGIRCALDDRRQTLEARIRDAEMNKVPYLLILGKREMQTQQVALRVRGQGDVGSMTLDLFLSRMRREIDERH